jgi:hypothetical protein
VRYSASGHPQRRYGNQDRNHQDCKLGGKRETNPAHPPGKTQSAGRA